MPNADPGHPSTVGNSVRRAARSVLRWLGQNGAVIGMLAVLVIFQSQKPMYLSPANLLSVATQSSPLIILAVGMMLVMSMRGVDLSVAQVADAAGLIAAFLILAGQQVWVAVLVPIAFGIVTGGINAVLMAYLGVPAIIGTLGMMFAVRGGELILSQGAQPRILFTLPDSVVGPFFFLGQGKLWLVPMPIVVAFLAVAAVWFLTSRTAHGRRMEAVGGNARASFLAGVDIRAIFGSGFVLSGVLAAIAGVMLVARTGIAAPRGVEIYLLDTFVAVFLGTVLTPGGGFSVLGTVGGALFVGMLGNGLTLLGLGAPVRYLIYGLAILVAIAINRLRRG